jgi:hypothetical protein
MPLVDDILNSLGKSQWFFTLELQSGFWQIKMVIEDVHTTFVIT